MRAVGDRDGSGASVVLSAPLAAATAAAQGAPSSSYRAVLDRYCTSCHNQRLLTANLNLDKAGVDLGAVSKHAAVLEKVLQKLETGSMPPPGLPRPGADTYRQFAGWLERELDRAAATAPNPGRPTAHRLNRAEYTNAIRDLLALEIDARSLLPSDDLSFGFDNNADILGLSPGLLERYLSTARKIARVAVGDPTIRPALDTYKVSPLLVQDERMSEDLPFGSRGGTGRSALLPARCRVHDQAPSDSRQHLHHPRPVGARADRSADRRRGGPPIHRRRTRGREEPDRGGRRSRGPAANQGRAAPGQRHVQETNAGGRRDRARASPGREFPSERDGARQRIPRADGNRERAGRRSVQRDGAGRHAQPPRNLRLPSGGTERRRAVRDVDSHEARPPRVSAAGDRRRCRRR